MPESGFEPELQLYKSRTLPIELSGRYVDLLHLVAHPNHIAAFTLRVKKNLSSFPIGGSLSKV